jgi:ubiquinone/menaquinone biosynthesis C-methylase UbiE
MGAIDAHLRRVIRHYEKGEPDVMSGQPIPNFGGSIPENYESYLVPLLFLDYAADLASRLKVPPGGAVLETACGTGAVTRYLRARLPDDVRLTITDLAPAMIEQVRQLVGDHANIEYRQADAGELPFADGSFDAVICQFGLMFLPDKVKGMREAARVLKPGGRFVFNSWERLERNVFCQAVHEAVAGLFPADPPRFLEVPFSYHDLSTIVRDLQEAGFGTIDVTVQPRTSRAPDPRHVALGLVAGSPLANQIMERGSPGLEETTTVVEASLSRQFGAGPISAPMQAFQISAQLPA